jgi:hypothetical protein
MLGTGLYQIDPHLPYLVTAVVYLPLLAFVWRARGTRHEEPEAPPQEG